MMGRESDMECDNDDVTSIQNYLSEKFGKITYPPKSKAKSLGLRIFACKKWES